MQEEAARVVIASAGGSASAKVVETAAPRLEALPMKMWEIGSGALRSVIAVCAAVRAKHHSSEPALLSPTSSLGAGSSDGDGSQQASSSCCGALDMLLVLSAAPVNSLLIMTSLCLEKLLPDALQVLACPDYSDKGEAAGQRQQQQQGRTMKGGRSAAKAKGELADGARDGAASSQCTAAAVASLRFLRLAALCLGGLLELGAAAVEEAAVEARCREGGGLAGMRAACGIIHTCLKGTGLLRAVMCEDAVRLLYGVLQAGPGGQSKADLGWQILLEERRRPGTADLLPILLLGVVESQTSCCRTLAGSLFSYGTGSARLRSQRQRFEAAADDSASLAEQLAIRCAMLCARVAAASPVSGQNSEEGNQLSPAAVEGLAAEIEEAASLGLQLTQSVRDAFDPAWSFQANAEAADVLAEACTTEGWLKNGRLAPSVLQLGRRFVHRQRAERACVQGCARDWGLLSSALSWAVAKEQPLSAFTDAFMTGVLDPHTMHKELSDAAGSPQMSAECGSSACPNVVGWAQRKGGSSPVGFWKFCGRGCGTWFCCRNCEDEADRLGHREACVFLLGIRRSIVRRGQSGSSSSSSSSSEKEEGSSSSSWKDHGDGSADAGSTCSGGSGDTLPLSPYEEGIDAGSSEDDGLHASRWPRQRQQQELHFRGFDELDHAARFPSAGVNSGELEEDLERWRAEQIQAGSVQEAGQQWRESAGAQQPKCSDGDEDLHYDYGEYDIAEEGQYEDAEEIADGQEKEGEEQEGDSRHTIEDEDEWETDHEGEDTDVCRGSQADGEQEAEGVHSVI